MSDSFGNKFYSGLGEFSLIYAAISLFFGILISIIFIIISLVIIFKKKVYTKVENATVTKSACSTVSGNDTVTYKCDIDIQYTVEGKDYVASLSKTSNVKYEIGSKIEIYHELNNPENASTSKDSNTVAYILIPISLFLSTILILNFILVRKYKGYAAISGGVTAASMIGRPFS